MENSGLVAGLGQAGLLGDEPILGPFWARNTFSTVKSQQFALLASQNI